MDRKKGYFTPHKVSPKTGELKKGFNYVWGITDSYYCYKKSKPRVLLDSNTYSKVIKDFFKELSMLIIRSNYELKIPKRLGFISIYKKRIPHETRRLHLDYKHFNETGKKVFLTNMHTDSNYFYWYWDKFKYKYTHFKNRFYYKFIPNRGNDGEIGKRGLAKWIKKCSIDPTIKDYDAIQK